MSGVAAIVLAAGTASRMGGRHKLLAEFGGEPQARRAARAALDAGARPVVVVTGHRHAEIAACLDGLSVSVARNPDFAAGMAGSLKVGLAALPGEAVSGVLVVLADMPLVTAAHMAALVAAFEAAEGRAVVRATAGGVAGNPVVLPAALFPALSSLRGDRGAREAIRLSGLPVVSVEIGAAALADADTPEAVETLGGVLRG
ncbi:nucleotidyltransferase family protein [Rhizobiaceae bacterium BDR2-2]|uniref:Nucleotidyltransferase family protein n=1 Tax=Ectorhizobium quercum TaxID=2965071 RepID=A0AAE3MZI1_9HYPH|nr:nucleotidyltransferase family protein [Ectorhizobium quercum]MCX8997963.1 nucleotidyltransferase family protein [Ectorhizobium quercum]